MARKKKASTLTIVVDIIHVIEYLWEAGRAFHPAIRAGAGKLGPASAP